MMSETTPDFSTCFYDGAVSHRRLAPVSNRFVYNVFSLMLDIDELPALARHSRWFGHNRLAPMSFHDKDHGAKDGSSLRPWIEEQLARGGFDFNPGRVRLLCFPRLFGFVFNPLSVWYCHDTDDRLRAILYEVRNTFGEWRGYLLPVDTDREDGAAIRQACDKAFYVSPLMEMDCRYHFTLNEPEETLSIAIRETRAGERTLLAAQTGRALPFSATTIRLLLGTHPLMFFKIVAAIHWQAVRTLIKGAPFRTNPNGPTGDVIYPGQNTAE